VEAATGRGNPKTTTTHFFLSAHVSLHFLEYPRVCMFIVAVGVSRICFVFGSLVFYYLEV